MKKSIISLILSLLLSTTIFAEGETPSGDKPCPQGQTTCRVAPAEEEETIIKSFTNFLISIFG